MHILVALLMTVVVLYCIGGYLMVKRVVEAAMDYIDDMPLLILLLPPCMIVALIFWPFVLAWESIEKDNE